MRNILFFTHSLNGGGAEKTVRNLSNYINKNRTEYKSYVCVVYDDEIFHDKVENLIVLKTKSNPKDNKLKKAINVIKQINEIRAIKKRLSIDVCISFLPGADIINVLSGTGERKIVSVRSKESLFTHSIFKKIYVKASYLLCDKIVAVSEVVRQDVIDFFGIKSEKVVTIHNAIDESGNDSYEILPEIEQFMDGHRVIINVGRLSPEKGQEHLIKAFAEINKQFPDTRLLILGEGEYRRKLEKQVIELGLNDAVLMPGKVQNPKAYLKKSDIFVLSSVVEGMPNVLLEALQCGLPCISTECGAREILAPNTDALYVASEINEEEYGILVPGYKQKDGINEDRVVDLLSEAMSLLLSDSAMRKHYSSIGKKHMEQYSMNSIYEKWRECFLDI